MNGNRNPRSITYTVVHDNDDDDVYQVCRGARVAGDPRGRRKKSPFLSNGARILPHVRSRSGGIQGRMGVIFLRSMGIDTALATAGADISSAL